MDHLITLQMKQSSASEYQPKHNPKVTYYSGQNPLEQAVQRAQVDRPDANCHTTKLSPLQHQSTIQLEVCMAQNPKLSSSSRSNRAGRGATVPGGPGTCRGGRFARRNGRPCGLPRRRRPARGGAERRAPDRPPAQTSTPSRRAAAGLEGAAAAGLEGAGFFGHEGLWGISFFSFLGHGFGTL
jgi:hypothetical protein